MYFHGNHLNSLLLFFCHIAAASVCFETLLIFTELLDNSTQINQVTFFQISCSTTWMDVSVVSQAGEAWTGPLSSSCTRLRTSCRIPPLPWRNKVEVPVREKWDGKGYFLTFPHLLFMIVGQMHTPSPCRYPILPIPVLISTLLSSYKIPWTSEHFQKPGGTVTVTLAGFQSMGCQAAMSPVFTSMVSWPQWECLVFEDLQTGSLVHVCVLPEFLLGGLMYTCLGNL